MSGYGKYAGKGIALNDIDSHLENYINEKMQRLYLKRNPPPPSKETTLKNPSGTIGGSWLQNDVRMVVAPTADDAVEIVLHQNATALKIVVILTFAFALMALTQREAGYLALIVCCHGLFMDEVLFRAKYIINCNIAYNIIEKTKKDKLVKDIIDS